MIFKLRSFVQVFILCQLPNRLFLMLWFYILCGVIWLIFMASCIVFVEVHSSGIGENLRVFKNTSPNFQHWTSVNIFIFLVFTKLFIFSFQVFLIITVICHDLVQMVVLSSYAIQCYLLRHYLYILNDKLIQNTIEPIDWMRVS